MSAESTITKPACRLVVVALVLVAGCEEGALDGDARVAGSQSAMTLNRSVLSCDEARCCPGGRVARVLSDGGDVEAVGEAGRCLVARAGADVIFATATGVLVA